MATADMALVRYLPDKPADRYRVVRWAPRSEDRRLFEYFPSLEMADMAVTFLGEEPSTSRTALSDQRSGDWARFERWFWSQATERFKLEAMPAWAHQEVRQQRDHATA